MIRVIIFDFDGVIVESVDIKTKAFTRLFEKENKSITEKIINYHINNTGISRYEKFGYIYKEFLKRPLSDIEFQKLCNNFANLVIDAVVNAPYVEGAREFLEDYGSLYSFFIASATPQGEIEEIAYKRNIDRFFKRIYGAPNKKTDVIREIIISENIKPSESLYIGDAISDYMAARDNAINFVARINNNESIFTDINCPKIANLKNLEKIIDFMNKKDREIETLTKLA